MKTTLSNEHSPNSWPTTQTPAFTLIELLVVIAIIAILASLLLSGLIKAKSKGQGIQCLSNLKQLTIAWWLYADDNNETLPAHWGDTNTHCWAVGFLDFYGSNTDNTNTQLLLDPDVSQLAPYTRSAGIYKCPADRSTVTIRSQRYPRVRSMGMNAFLGDDGYGPSYPSRDWLGAAPYRIYWKRTDITDPAPTGVFVFADEHPDSILGGAFAVKCDAQGPNARFEDWPASYHNGACGFSFADSHSEIKRWLDPRTKPVVKYDGWIQNLPTMASSPNNPDIAWMQERASSLQVVPRHP
jgi:prepilin-type N-terminal cleavage/methylation domain-containing protein